MPDREGAETGYLDPTAPRKCFAYRLEDGFNNALDVATLDMRVQVSGRSSGRSNMRCGGSNLSAVRCRYFSQRSPYLSIELQDSARPKHSGGRVHPLKEIHVSINVAIVGAGPYGLSVA